MIFVGMLALVPMAALVAYLLFGDLDIPKPRRTGRRFMGSQAELVGVLCDPKIIHMAAAEILVNAVDAHRWNDYGLGESP